MMIFLQALASGIVTGSIYALLALGLVIIFKATEAVNFAHGEIFMIGAYSGLIGYSYLDLPYPLVFIITFLLAYMIGFSLERLVLRSVLKGRGEIVAMIIATVGFSVFIKGTLRFFNITEFARSFPPLFPSKFLPIGSVIISAHSGVILLMVVIIMVVFFMVFKFTKAGKAMQAVSQNFRAAYLVGISVPRVFSLTWSLACGLGAVSGLLIGPVILIHTDMGIILIQAFAAAIIGGIKNLPGAIVGGFIVGVIENMVGLYISTNFIVIAPFITIILVLIFKPEGIFTWGKKRVA
jgi:branched-chain amino acid transport system permease protein